MQMRKQQPLTVGNGSGLEEAIQRITALVLDGLKHGFFEYSIQCERTERGRRSLLIRAGKSHKFTITEDELPRG